MRVDVQAVSRPAAFRSSYYYTMLVIIHTSIVISINYSSGQKSLVGKALDSQAERYWVRSSPRPLKALNMSD
jgi:hypothetical protein